MALACAQARTMTQLSARERIDGHEVAETGRAHSVACRQVRSPAGAGCADGAAWPIDRAVNPYPLEMSTLLHACRLRGHAARYAFASVLAVCPPSMGAQLPATPASSDSTWTEAVIGAPMGATRGALHAFLLARGWALVADSIADIGTPSLHAGRLAGRPAEIVGVFGDSSGRLLNLVMNVPASSPEELRAAYADLYRLLERTRCTPTIARDYAAQRDSILRGVVPHLPASGSVVAYKPLMAGHSTLSWEENADWPRPVWANADAQIGTQLTVSLLDRESKWPYQVTAWSSVEMLERATMCTDSRLAETSAANRRRDARLTARRTRTAVSAKVLDSVLVVVGPGVTLRVGTLVVRGTEHEPAGTARIVRVPLGSTVQYQAHVGKGYEGLTVVAADTTAAAEGSIVLDETSSIVAVARPSPRVETRRLYELMRRELTSKDAHVAYVAVECEVERLLARYPATAEDWIHEARVRAHDSETDGKAMRRFDDAMAGNFFSGCVLDLQRYPAAAKTQGRAAEPDARI